MSNNTDPDETAHYEPSHLDLHCFQKPIVIVKSYYANNETYALTDLSYVFFCFFFFDYYDPRQLKYSVYEWRM